MKDIDNLNIMFSSENLYPLYGNGEAVATYEEDLVYSPHETFWNNWGGFYSGLFGTRESYYSTYSETNYFATDLLGSVKVTTNTRGEVSGKTSYDVFGSLYGSNGTLAESSLMFAYTGKTWNDITELSNYGFRDYAPQIARFTTVDPIRDGSNWYAYVHNDPVNCVDLWGLTASDSNSGNIFSSIGNFISNLFVNKTESQLPKQKIVVFAQVDLTDSPNNVFYNLLVNWKCRKIKKEAKKQGYDFELKTGTNGSASEFDKAQQDSSIARIIVLGHGYELTGEIADENNESIKDKTSIFSIKDSCVVPIIDMVGCYARKNDNYQSFTNTNGTNVIVNTYNDRYIDENGLTQEDEIWWNQTNEVLNTVIPESIKSGNPNSGGVPTVKKDTFTYWLRGLFS